MIITTRKSPLALAQSEYVQGKLANILDQPPKIVGMQASGDIDHKLIGILKNSFTKEIESNLLTNAATIAVHSLKDMSIASHPDLYIAAYCGLAQRSDLLILNQPLTADQLADPLRCIVPNMIVGTSSLRRSLQLKSIAPNIAIRPLRGNIHTRLQKLHNAEYDAIILASAGLARMQDNLSYWHTRMASLPLSTWYPAPGQGILAVQCRADDIPTRNLLKQINDPKAERIANIERLFCATIGADCHDPVACLYTNPAPGHHELSALIMDNQQQAAKATVNWQHQSSTPAAIEAADIAAVNLLIQKLNSNVTA